VNSLLDKAIDATLVYLLFGGVASLLVAVAVGFGVSLGVGFVFGAREGLKWNLRAFCFMLILFLCGAPANCLFTLTLRDRFYTDNDPLVDWLPWVPSGDWIIDIACQGHYLPGGSPWLLRIAWGVLALPVWIVAILIFRRVFSTSIEDARALWATVGPTRG
jgi:energy-coupling factor transporter transmembrane protein EcfT